MSSAWFLTNFIAAWLLPPLNLIALGFVGLLLFKRRRSLARVLGAGALIGLTALSMPAVGKRLLAWVELPHATIHPGQAEAIVILGGGVYYAAPEYAGDTLGHFTLERVRYGALLARQTGKPVLVTGGAPDGGCPEGELMQEVLAREFKVPVRWVEKRSRTSRENAAFSAEMLQAAGIHRIWLVSHAWHLRRAVPEFERHGLQVIPAGTRFARTREDRPLDFVPSTKGLLDSTLAFHEGIGIIWYRIRNALQEKT
jgi:uncharacterized SAM-binding protein YcdF (DUF218 family)